VSAGVAVALTPSRGSETVNVVPGPHGVDLDAAAVALDDTVDDRRAGRPEPSPTSLVVKMDRGARQHLGRDARAVVAQRDQRATVPLAGLVQMVASVRPPSAWTA
jgi:hypothetical protein